MDLSTDEVDCLCWYFDGEALGGVVASIIESSTSHVYQLLGIVRLGSKVGYQDDSVMLSGKTKRFSWSCIAQSPNLEAVVCQPTHPSILPPVARTHGPNYPLVINIIARGATVAPMRGSELSLLTADS